MQLLLEDKDLVTVFLLRGGKDFSGLDRKEKLGCLVSADEVRQGTALTVPAGVS